MRGRLVRKINDESAEEGDSNSGLADHVPLDVPLDFVTGVSLQRSEICAEEASGKQGRIVVRYLDICQTQQIATIKLRTFVPCQYQHEVVNEGWQTIGHKVKVSCIK